MVNNELFFKIRDLRNITRFNKRLLHVNDTVSSHSYYVTVLSLLVSLEYIEKSGNISINPTSVMSYSLLHDIEESVLGDVLTPTKYRNTEYLNQYNKLKDDVIDDMLKGNEFLKSVELNEQEKLVFKFCDMFEAYSTSMEEYYLYGNKQFEFISSNYKSKILDFVSVDSHLSAIFATLDSLLLRHVVNGVSNEY